jgi:uncharacterized protein YbjT (DUF2867 family)
MTTSPILILGGAGKTGRRVATQLSAHGVEVRLASRSSERRLDWYDASTWSAAVRGSDSAYLAPPVDPAGLDAAGRFVQRAAFEGLRRVVLLSGRGVGNPGREFAVYDSQLALEEAVKDSGLDWTILQPAWFMQNFSEAWLVDYVQAGELRLSAGDGAEAWITTDDVGDVATAALLDQRHIGQTYALSGPRPLTLDEVAAELTAATGRRVDYVPLDPDEHVAEMVGFGVPGPEAEAVRDLFAVIRNHLSDYVSDGVYEVLGRQPRDFTDWARATAAQGAWTRVGQTSHSRNDDAATAAGKGRTAQRA